MKQTRTSTLRSKQSGASLLIFAIIALTVAGGAYFIQDRNASNPHIKNSIKTQKALAQAKYILENYSIAFDPSQALQNPIIGRLPFPDRLKDGLFDGFANCISSTAPSNEQLMGRFPSRGTNQPCSVVTINADLKDSSNNQLWYVVSEYMVQNSINMTTNFNPALLDPDPLAFANWLTIYDENGTIISDRVAFIVFAPGTALAGQDRINPSSNNFLESHSVQGQGIINNAVNDLRFVKADVSNDFNDQLIYMTIDELMPKLERRVLNEFRILLNQHLIGNDEYPLPATLTNFSHECDLSTAPSPGYGFIANTNNDCPSSLIIPAYLTPWLDYILYEPRADCVNNNQVGCDNEINGLTVNAETNIDYVLISTGFHPTGTFDPTTYITDSINQNNNQIYITPTADTSINRDQILFK